MAELMSSVAIVSVLPGLLGTYGDAGNEIALVHRLRARGIPVHVIRVDPGVTIPRYGDIYLLGGGEDRAQELAVTLIDDGLGQAVERDATVFGVCAGFQILGESFTDSAGTTHAGLGLLDAVTTPLTQRAVGEVLVDCGIPGVGRLAGFENHQGGTRLGPSTRPLGSIAQGVGNAHSPETDGAWQGRVVGTYLHGPVLALNPLLADCLLAWTVGDLPPIDDALANRARALRRP